MEQQPQISIINMILDEELLEKVAQNGSMDYERWPGQIEPLLQRIDEIAFSEFPIPKAPQDSNPSHASHGDSISLPSQLQSLLDSIKSTLRTYFAQKPPHTIQRLAELILRPTRQYRTLPAYLRALDRVIAVSSSADIFPLPRAGEGELANGFPNGSSSSFMVTDESLGSDESLGGALLTPIPWLTNSDLEAVQVDIIPEGAVPVRPDAAVTQGELIRQEQEAGLIANTQTPPQSSKEGEDIERTSPQPEEIPHARGPSVLGVEDLGLQNGKGVQMTLSDQTKSQEGEEVIPESDAADGEDTMDVSVTTAEEERAFNEVLKHPLTSL